MQFNFRPAVKRLKDIGRIGCGALVLSMAIFTGSVFRYVDSVEIQRETYLEATKGFGIYYEDKWIGNVKESKEGLDIAEKLQSELSSLYGAKVVIEHGIEIKETHFDPKFITSEKMIYETLRNNISVQVEVAGIYVDGKKILNVRTIDEANKLLNDLKFSDLEQTDEVLLLNSEFIQNVEIKKIKTSISEVQDIETAKMILQRGTDEEKIHEVEPGEVTSVIAQNYGISLSDLETANPGKDMTLIYPGDELNLIVPKPYLSVKNHIKKTYIEKNMPFENIYRESASYYKDEEFVVVSGEKGESKLVCEIDLVDGVEVSRNILEEEIIKMPKEAIVVKGTKAIPALKGTGRFSLPINGRLTSPFGNRRSGFHTGIDLAAKTGTPIKAADGGVVTFSGYKGNYGYVIDVDHGGGFITRYAHCSALYAKVGDKVYKDKTIAAVGNTGNSTGPHVHFEVRKYGKAVNPYSYIGKNYR